MAITDPVVLGEWLGSYLADAPVPDADLPTFQAWLASDYEPLAGGWQY